MQSFDFESHKGIESFMNMFEAGELADDSWHHFEHLVMCLWYLQNHSELDAILKIKFGIMKYNLLYGLAQTEERGYHETITLFFVKLVTKFKDSTPKEMPWPQQLKMLKQQYPDFKETISEYYSKDLIQSSKARRMWTEPDLKNL